MFNERMGDMEANAKWQERPYERMYTHTHTYIYIYAQT